MSDKMKSCPRCGAQLPFNSTICTSCGAEQSDVTEPHVQHPTPGPLNPPIGDHNRVNDLWYAVSLFTIIGGGIAWIVNRKRDPNKARNFLIVGALTTIVLFYLIYR